LAIFKINPTLQNLFDEIQDDTDIGNGQDYVSDKQLVSFINRGIQRFEPIIHNLNQDYYRSEYVLAVVNNQSQYSLPSEIFASKIRRIYYSKTSDELVPVKKIKTDEEMIYYMTLAAGVNTSGEYRYMIVNYSANASSDAFSSTVTATGQFIRFLPIPANDGALIIYYLRNAKKFEWLGNSTDYTATLDVPDFAHFISTYAKLQVALKRKNWNMVNAFKAELDEIREELKLVLNPAQMEDDNRAQLDDFHYIQQTINTGYY
jgi:hypothetical protein